MCVCFRLIGSEAKQKAESVTAMTMEATAARTKDQKVNASCNNDISSNNNSNNNSNNKDHSKASFVHFICFCKATNLRKNEYLFE